MIAVITGASSGIGEATARRLAREPGTRLVLVARRRELMEQLVTEIGGDHVIVDVDLTADDAPAKVRDAIEQQCGGRVDLLVNNAGRGGRGTFGDTGYDKVAETMALNFDAQLRLTEALLPLLRTSAPSSIVNVASTAGRVSRAGAGAYSATKFALIGWSEALSYEEKPHGVHVGVVNPGFIATEGFPQQELIDNRKTRWMVSTADKVADAIVDAGPGGKAERYVPRPYRGVAVLKAVAPGLVNRVLGGSGGMTGSTKE